jgi:U3 small nucleolar RNA-associated protein 22
MSAAASGKYDDMVDDEEDNSEEEDDDDEDEEEEEEDEEEEDNGVNGKAFGKKSKKNQYVSELYQPPTNQEMQGLKETSDLFKSNIFKMEVSVHILGRYIALIQLYTNAGN